MATQQQVARFFANAIAPAKPRARVSQTAKRNAIRDAQIVALEDSIAAIRRKAREMPAWANGYNSAVTAIELQIAALRTA